LVLILFCCVIINDVIIKERLLVTIFVCPSVLWLTFFLSHFRYNIIHLLLLIITITFVPPFDDDDFEGLRISVLLAKREGVCGSFSLSKLLF
jgi:hypothetical protein